MLSTNLAFLWRKGVGQLDVRAVAKLEMTEPLISNLATILATHFNNKTLTFRRGARSWNLSWQFGFTELNNKQQFKRDHLRMPTPTRPNKKTFYKNYLFKSSVHKLYFFSGKFSFCC